MIQKRYDCVGIGFCSWDEFMPVSNYPEENSKNDVLQSYETPGGPVLNALRILSALGKYTFYAGQVGDDYRGNKLQVKLIEEEVSFPENFINSSIKTNFAHLWINDKNASLTVCSFADAEYGFSRSYMEHIIANTRTVLIDNRNFKNKIENVKFAREQNVRTFCDFGTYREGSDDLLKYIDIAIFSRKYIEDRYPGMDFTKVMRIIKKMGPKEIIITDGENGVIIKASDRDPIKMRAFPVSRVVDTTGAGDTFHGGWIFRRIFIY